MSHWMVSPAAGNLHRGHRTSSGSVSRRMTAGAVTHWLDIRARVSKSKYIAETPVDGLVLLSATSNRVPSFVFTSKMEMFCFSRLFLIPVFNAGK